MKLVTFSTADTPPRVGVVVGDQIVDVTAHDRAIPDRMEAFLEAGQEARSAAEAALEAGAPRLPIADVVLHAPVLRPGKVLAVGLNYADHVEEAGMDRPTLPMIFNKQSTSVEGPGVPVHLPRISDKLDYEGELAVVIGRRCRHVPAARAAEVIGGYTICNDVSVRDWQMRSPTFTMGKSFDTHCPLGPWIVTGDEIGDPHALQLRTWVNGELRQDSNTKHLIFDCFDLVEHLSTAFTLEPGDVIATGTPGGVGATMRPRCYLESGDVVRIAIEGIGELENAVVPEPESTVVF
jgi:2-keto-4-pentenoate hydratase/2-oxohepta-3-ene-1,7-dioic acid hydratase in catechol pathway